VGPKETKTASLAERAVDYMISMTDGQILRIDRSEGVYYEEQGEVITPHPIAPRSTMIMAQTNGTHLTPIKTTKRMSSKKN
jgi:hypothetical protein